VTRDGWALLRDARWNDARAWFRAAGETPETLEGLSWAAWWLDDADAAFDRDFLDFAERRHEDGGIAYEYLLVKREAPRR
jgi:hypothetical protein